MSWHIRAQFIELDSDSGEILGKPHDEAILLDENTEDNLQLKWRAFCSFCDNFGILSDLNWPAD